MVVEVQCPWCGGLRQADEALAGQMVPCGQCGRNFTVGNFVERTIQPGGGSEPSEAQPADRQTNTPAAGSSPATIGRYAVVRKLGAGALGVVWLAYDPQFDRDVAIKVLPDSVSKDVDCLKRFLREAELAAKLQHPNTVTVYDVGANGDLTYMVMELVEGGSLGQAVSEHAMEWREATRAVRDAALGLAAAHQLGLVHRDIKPENLMRTGEGVTKLADFGLARSRLVDSRFAQQGMWLATPAYMAPELWRGGEADARSDLYALALTYYHLLAGRPPFTGEQFLQVAYQHVHEPLPDPRAFAAGLPDAVCRLLLRGAAKAPAERHSDGADFAAELDALLALPPETLTFGTPWEELGRGRGRQPSPPTLDTPKELTNSIGMKLMLLPAGEFQMGSNEREHEKPIHGVRITKPFYLGVYPVTQEEYQAVMGENPSRFTGDGRRPVENVSWDDAMEFCRRLSAKEDKQYRLPTEAEWESACRAGSTAKWCFGDKEDELGDYAWHEENSADTTHAVGGKKANAWGLYDMHGNVWEWCADLFDDGYPANLPTDDPTGPTTGSNRVFRGGGWGDSAGDCRSAARHGIGPSSQGSGLGFRLALVP